MTTLKELKSEWYLREDVLKEIIRFTKFREVAFLTKKGDKTVGTAIRYKTCWTERFFTILLEEYCQEENTNIYISVGNIMFPFTKDTFKEKLSGYDLFFDFDGEVIKKDKKEFIDLESPKRDTIKLIEELIKFKIPYSVMYTGRKGFQIRVFSKNIPEKYKILERDKLFRKLAENIKKKLKLKTLDEKQYLITQLMKLPLSYCDSFICTPLSYKELKDFDKWNYHIKNMIKKPITYLLENNFNITTKESKTNFNKFYNKYNKLKDKSNLKE